VIRALILALAAAAPASAATGAEPRAFVVGSKKFTESVILAEMAAQVLRGAALAAHHRRELGGTRVLWNALLRGDVDVYPDYTGTLLREILASERLAQDDRAALERALAAHGVSITAALGFSNNYALGLLPGRAAELGLRRISDLAAHPRLRLGFGNEFLDRADGWPGLAQRYGLGHRPVGLDHDLAYRALAAGTLDLIDVYTTDAEIAYYGLFLLDDDRGYFPRYDAVLVYRTDSGPALRAALARLEGRIDRARMTALNRRVKIEGESEAAVAARFLAEELDLAPAPGAREGWAPALARLTGEHLVLTGISLSAAIAVAVPLGIVAARRRRLGQWLLAGAGIVQTVPALALLVALVPVLGIGGPPAVVALFVYSLLPVLRNTCTGLTGIPASLLESADAMGLPRRQRLWHVELPLAVPSILAGIKTSAVINVGTATLGALVGAGGYGQPILTGIRLDDTALILQGAVPAALLALAVQGLFDRLEHRLTPRGLRL